MKNGPVLSENVGVPLRVPLFEVGYPWLDNNQGAQAPFKHHGSYPCCTSDLHQHVRFSTGQKPSRRCIPTVTGALSTVRGNALRRVASGGLMLYCARG